MYMYIYMYRVYKFHVLEMLFYTCMCSIAYMYMYMYVSCVHGDHVHVMYMHVVSSSIVCVHVCPGSVPGGIGCRWNWNAGSKHCLQSRLPQRPRGKHQGTGTGRGHDTCTWTLHEIKTPMLAPTLPIVTCICAHYLVYCLYKMMDDN